MRYDWTRLGNLVIHSPRYREDRKAWYVKVRDLRTGFVRKIRLPVEDKRATARAKRAALDVAQELIQVESETESLPVRKAVTLFLAEKRKELAESSLQDLKYVLTTYFVPKYGRRLLSSIKPADVKEAISKETWGSRMRSKAKAHLHNLFNWAVVNRYLDMNPVAAVRVKGTPSDRVKVAFSPEEAVRLIELAHEPQTLQIVGKRNRHPQKTAWQQRILTCRRLQRYVTFGFYTGLRPSAIVKLPWKAVNFREGRIEIPALIMKNRKALILPLHRDLAHYLRDRLKEEKRPRPDNPIVGGNFGSLSRPFEKLVKRLARELEDTDPQRAEEILKASPRSTRYSFASWIIKKSPLPVVQRLLGHSPRTVGIVTERYLVPAFSDLKAAIDSLPLQLPVEVVVRKTQQS